MGGTQIDFDKEFFSLSDKFNAIRKNAPDYIYDCLNKSGNELKKELKGHTPKSKKTLTNPKKKMVNSWTKKSAEYENGGFVVKIRSKAPHFHLVEEGHRKVVRTKKGLKQIGYVKGKFFAKKVIDDFEDNFYKDLESRFDKIIEKELR